MLPAQMVGRFAKGNHSFGVFIFPQSGWSLSYPVKFDPRNPTLGFKKPWRLERSIIDAPRGPWQSLDGENPKKDLALKESSNAKTNSHSTVAFWLFALCFVVVLVLLVNIQLHLLEGFSHLSHPQPANALIYGAWRPPMSSRETPS